MVTVRPCSIIGGEREGRDEGRLGRPSRQRQDRDVRRQHTGQAERQRDQWQQQEARQAGPGREHDRHGTAQHDQIAMREVDRARGVQRQHEAERDQRIGHAQRQGIEDELEGDQCRLSPRAASLRRSPLGHSGRSLPRLPWTLMVCCGTEDVSTPLSRAGDLRQRCRDVAQDMIVNAPWARACPGSAARCGGAC